MKTRAKRYTVKKRLGSGRFATVFLVFDNEKRTERAAKVLNPKLFAIVNGLKRFLQEVEILRRLDHPNIVKVFESGDDFSSVSDLADAKHFMVLEFLDGPNLRDHLSGSFLPLDEALGIAIDLARALISTHSISVVHRDLTNENVMLVGSQAKVIDFGVSLDLANTEVLDLPGTVIGSLNYMAPEQFFEAEVDFRADVYALGIVLFEMLTGRYPFPSTGFMDAFRSRETMPSLAGTYASNSPGALHALFSDVFAHYSSDRPTMGEIEERLVQIRGQL